VKVRIEILIPIDDSAVCNIV